MTEEEFFQACPHHLLDECREAIDLGFKDYPLQYANSADKHSSRAVATLIHDHIVDRVKQRLVPEVLTFQFINQRNIFCYRDLFLIVFKKLDENLRSSNYPTESATKFNNQQNVAGIPPNLPRIEMGYIPDPAGAKINGIFAVRRLGKKIDWSIDLYNADGPQQRDIKLFA